MAHNGQRCLTLPCAPKLCQGSCLLLLFLYVCVELITYCCLPDALECSLSIRQFVLREQTITIYVLIAINFMIVAFRTVTACLNIGRLL